jgi:hypothetical protein
METPSLSRLKNSLSGLDYWEREKRERERERRMEELIDHLKNLTF